MLIGHSVADAFGRLIAVDHHFCEMTKRSERDLLGLSYTELTHPGDLDYNVSLVGGLASSGGAATIRKRYLCPDSSVTWATVEVTRLASADGSTLAGTIRHLDRNAPLSSPVDLWLLARDAVSRMQRRRQRLGNDLFGDFGWIILLKTYLAEVEGEQLDPQSLASQLGIGNALTERWTKVLQARGLLDSVGSGVQLSLLGFNEVEALLDLRLPS